MQVSRHRFAWGYTLIELIVVFACVMILLSLTLTGVQAVREASRKFRCSNNLRQQALGVSQFLTQSRSFPANGGYTEDSFVRARGGELVPISTFDKSLSMRFFWGVGKPGRGVDDQPGSWAYAILPYLGQQLAYESVEFRSTQSSFLCPTRARAEPLPTVEDEFGIYVSGGWAWAKTDYAANARMAPNHPGHIKIAAVSDGLSNTILIGEKAHDNLIHRATTWYWDEPLFSGGSQGTARDGTLIVPDGIRYEYKRNWGAAHNSIHFAKCDGSVNLLAFDIDWQVFEAMLTIAEGD